MRELTMNEVIFVSGGTGSTPPPPPPPKPRLPGLIGFVAGVIGVQACQDGLGIAQLPQPLALPALKKGKLNIVLPQHQIEGWQLFIHYPSRKQLPARVRAFVDFCIEHFGGHADLSADTAAFVANSLKNKDAHKKY